MSEARSRISLRVGPRRNRQKQQQQAPRPVISAPRQISEPVPQVPALPRGGPRSVTEAPGVGGVGGVAPPRPSPSPDPGLAPPGPGPQPRPRPPPQAGGDKTSDLVKRRYSTRFNIPDNFDPTAPPVPSVPSLDKYAYQNNRGAPPPSRGGGGGAAPIVDPKALRDPRLVPDAYVANLLGEATEDQIRDFEASLRDLKDRANIDLQQNVLQNRTQFIKISKEAEKLKSEMRALKNLMSDLKSNTTALRAASAAGGESTSLNGELSTGLSKRNKRSSVADRSALWNSQMQALYKNVEGSQKFLPNSAGRHVIQNAGQWVELDNATYKSRRAMQIFLLNDHLLIASRKKRKTDGPQDPRANQGPMLKLVADKCWPLLDVEVVDMASSIESSSGRNKLADAIMVRGVGQDSFIYRTDKPEDPDKNSLLLNMRKAVEELRKNLQSEMEASNKAKETINYFASRDPGLLQKTELLETLSDIKDMLIEVDGKQQNLRWVESQMDELDIDVALQNFDDVVARVEKLKSLARGLKNNVVAQDFINFKVEERCTKVADMILWELEHSHNAPNKTRRNVAWLQRLGFEDRAREAYLEARHKTIQKRSRQCIFQGDLHMYIWEISFVYFSIIRNTVSCFQSCFPPPMMSACVKWAKEEVEAFNTILARQLSSTERDGKVWQDCMERAELHAAMLSEVGLDFRNMIGRGLKDGDVSADGVGLGLS